MPNWIEGCLKVRGKKENLLKFLNEGLKRIDQREFIFKIEQDFEEEIELNIKNDSEFWIKDTRRSFVSYDYLSIDNEKEENVLTFNYKSAWAISSEELQKISDEFQIDFKIFGVERGMEFTQDLEITKGKVLMDNAREYADWKWECPFPNMGG